MIDNLIRFAEAFSQYARSGQLPDLGIWSYFLLAALVALEGPLTTLLGAAAASAGLLRPGWVFVSAATGNLTADMLWYSLGYAGKTEWIMTSGRMLGVRQSHLERLRRSMHDHAPKILFLAKLSAAFMIPSLIAAGLAKTPWKRWFPVLLLGETIWTGSLVLLGYYATEAIKQVEAGIQVLIVIGSLSFVVLIVWLLRHRLRSGNLFPEANSNGNHSDA